MEHGKERELGLRELGSEGTWNKGLHGEPLRESNMHGIRSLVSAMVFYLARDMCLLMVMVPGNELSKPIVLHPSYHVLCSDMYWEYCNLVYMSLVLERVNPSIHETLSIHIGDQPFGLIDPSSMGHHHIPVSISVADVPLSSSVESNETIMWWVFIQSTMPLTRAI